MVRQWTSAPPAAATQRPRRGCRGVGHRVLPPHHHRLFSGLPFNHHCSPGPVLRCLCVKRVQSFAGAFTADTAPRRYRSLTRLTTNQARR